ncbi:MAG: DUF169 domain-containing protein [Lachnospiraceae bacterium]|nr:DUF169 domain-containing protein [Lachnospiraceae bacterium]
MTKKSKQLSSGELQAYMEAGKTIKDNAHLYRLVALTFLESDDEIPENVVRPLRDMQQHLPLCQMTHYARTVGKTVVSTLEDHFCMPAASVFGLTDKFPVGIDIRHFRDQEARQVLEGIVKERDTYLKDIKGLVFSPLEDLRMRPDLIVVYGNPGQISMLCKCFTWQGIPVSGQFLGSIGCSSMVWSLIHQKPVMNVMAGGERAFAYTGDHEISLVFPADYLFEVAKAIKITQETGANLYPIQCGRLYGEPPLPSDYRITYREIEQSNNTGGNYE